MKPKTPIQKEVIRLSATLPELTNAQRTYAFHHCFKHYGRRTAKGVITCTECGHAWKSGHSLADTLCGCTCPNCGTALEITDTRKRVFVDNEYFSIITTCKGYQVIRFFFVRSRQKVGQKAEYSIFEVAQRWIAPDGKSETVARLRGFSLLYYDLWNEDSPMEIRRNNQHKVYDIDPICTYPRRRIIPEIKPTRVSHQPSSEAFRRPSTACVGRPGGLPLVTVRYRTPHLSQYCGVNTRTLCSGNCPLCSPHYDFFQCEMQHLGSNSPAATPQHARRCICTWSLCTRHESARSPARSVRAQTESGPGALPL